MPTCPNCQLYVTGEGPCPACNSYAATAQQRPYAEPEPAQPGYAQPGYAQPGYAMPGYAQPAYAQPAPRFRSINGLRDATVAALVGVGAFDVLSISAQLHRRSVIDAIRAGTATEQSASFSDRLVTVADFGGLLVLLIAAAAFITWLYRGYGNLHGAYATRFKPGWAIGSWFVPFLNLVRPKQIVDEMWRRGDSPGSAEMVHRGRVPAWIHLWWGVFLLSNWLDGVAVRLDDNTLDGLRNSATTTAVGDALNLVAVALGILLVRRMTARHDRMAAAVLHGTAGSPAIS